MSKPAALVTSGGEPFDHNDIFFHVHDNLPKRSTVSEIPPRKFSTIFQAFLVFIMLIFGSADVTFGPAALIETA